MGSFGKLTEIRECSASWGKGASWGLAVKQQESSWTEFVVCAFIFTSDVPNNTKCENQAKLCCIIINISLTAIF